MHIFCLAQVSEHEALQEIWEWIYGAPKRHQLVVLQQSQELTSRRLEFHTLFALGLIKITLSLVFWLEHWDDLGKFLYQLILGHNTTEAQKVTKDWYNQHQVVLGGEGSPTLAYAATLTAMERVNIPEILTMAQIAKLRLWVLVETILVPDHSTTLVLTDFGMEVGGR